MTKVYGDYNPNDVIIIDLETRAITPQLPYPSILNCGWLWCGRKDRPMVNISTNTLLDHHIQSAEVMVGHNIIGFDIPVMMEHAKNSNLIPDDLLILDTMLLSQIIYADRTGGHSLDNLAAHFNCPIKKVEIDFSLPVTKDKLAERVSTDVTITKFVMESLLHESGLTLNFLNEENSFEELFKHWKIADEKKRKVRKNTRHVPDWLHEIAVPDSVLREQSRRTTGMESGLWYQTGPETTTQAPGIFDAIFEEPRGESRVTPPNTSSEGD